MGLLEKFKKEISQEKDLAKVIQLAEEKMNQSKRKTNRFKKKRKEINYIAAIRAIEITNKANRDIQKN